MAVRTAPGLPLTSREHEVARLVAEGLTDRQIASRLCISERTVHAHLRAAYAKTGTGTRTRLTLWLARRGQVSI
jgi:DNA-binding NarL/FixJ family response regulator